MDSIITWFEAHDKLAGWAQFFGAIIALAVTYFTAFAPHWRRKRQLRKASERLLAHGHEVLESYHRTFSYFLPYTISLKGAVLSIRSIVSEINKFPIYDLEDQGVHSTARRLVTMSVTLEHTCLVLDDESTRLGDKQMSEEDRDFMRSELEKKLKMATALLTGATIKRPDASDFIGEEFTS
jgi:hypothetical protein